MAVVTTNNPRELPWPAVAYISRRVQFNTPGIATVQTVPVGNLPGGAIITKAMVVVHTVFNAASTNVFIVGTGTGNNEIFDAASAGSTVTEGTTGAYESAAALGYTVSAAGEVVYVNYTQTGTAASTGDATVIIQYCGRIG